MKPFRGILNFIERLEPEKPIIQKSDRDTCRVYFPHSDKYITFTLDNVNDGFLTSPRTLRDMKKYGVGINVTSPMSAQKREAERDGNNLANLGPRDVHWLARRHKVTPREFVVAGELVKKYFLDTWQEKTR